MLWNQNSLSFSGRGVCHIFQPPIGNGSAARLECEYMASNGVIHDER